MPRGPTHAATIAWTRLVRAQAVAVGEVERAFKAASLPSLDWYDVLWELERARRPLRPTELESALLITQYNLSRLLGRMRKAGLIDQQVSEEDRRRQFIQLTDAGRSRRQAMWPIYAEAIVRVLGDKMSEPDLMELGRLLGRVARPTSK